MELGTFRQIFDPVKARLAEIDSIVREGGQHINEEQQARLLKELDLFDDAAARAAHDGLVFLGVKSAGDEAATPQPLTPEALEAVRIGIDEAVQASATKDEPEPELVGATN